MTWRRFCYRFYKRIQRVLVPGLIHTQVAYARKLKTMVTPDTRWLELGCGHELLHSWSATTEELEELAARPRLLAGLDVTFQSLRRHARIQNKVQGTATQLPFADETFDLVAANMVVEHLPDSDIVLKEMRRILAPGGRFVFHTTNRSHYMFRLAQSTPRKLRNKIIWVLQRRAEQDIFPTLYQMNDPRTIETLAARSGLKVRELNMMESESMTIALGPLVVFELLMTRILLMKPFWKYRSNIIAVLEKPAIHAASRAEREAAPAVAQGARAVTVPRDGA